MSGCGNCLVPRATASQRTLSICPSSCYCRYSLEEVAGPLMGASLRKAAVSGHHRSRNDSPVLRPSRRSLNRFHSNVPVNSLRQILSVRRCSSNVLGRCSRFTPYLSHPIAFRITASYAPYLCLFDWANTPYRSDLLVVRFRLFPIDGPAAKSATWRRQCRLKIAFHRPIHPLNGALRCFSDCPLRSPGPAQCPSRST
jgi:hypothetical protein